MSGPPLSQQEFERWCEGDWSFKERVLNHIETQYARNILVEGRVSTLEEKTAKVNKVSWVSIAVAIIGALGTMLSAVLGGNSGHTTKAAKQQSTIEQHTGGVNNVGK